MLALAVGILCWIMAISSICAIAHGILEKNTQWIVGGVIGLVLTLIVVFGGYAKYKLEYWLAHKGDVSEE